MQSIIHKGKRCFLCGCKGTDEHHVFMGDKQRAKSEQWGLKVRLCHRHHMRVHNPQTLADKMAGEYLQKVAQEAFEQKIGTREMFMDEFGRNYL